MNLKIPQATKAGYIEVIPYGAFDWCYPSSQTRRGRVQENGTICPTITCNPESIFVYEPGKSNTSNMTEIELREYGCTNTLTSVQKDNFAKDVKHRIRKLTPRECFRLMGVDDKDIDTIQNVGISNTQQYKMAGNSIVVDVLYHIFRKAFVDKQNEERQLTLW